MSFLFPAFLFGAVAIAVPIILHLMKRDVAPRVPFSDIRFLRRAPMMQARRRRLRQLLLLALRVASLLLLVAAFARPFFDDSGLIDRPVTVVALDRSFSMGGPGVFDRAKARAAAALTDAPSDHVVGLVVFDHAARVVRELTADRAAVTAALAAVEPGAGGTRFGAGLSAAVDLAGAREGRILVVTDMQSSGWDVGRDVEVPDTLAVETASVDGVQNNLAVTSVQVGPADVTALVFNTGEERSSQVSLQLVGDRVSQTEVTLRSGLTEVVFEVRLPQTGRLTVSVVDPTGFPADDTRHVLLDPPAPATVGVVADGGRLDAGAFYLERALLAGEEESPFAVVAISPDTLSSRDLTDLDAVVVVGTAGLDRRGRARLATFVADGGGLLIVAGPAFDPALVADVLGDATPVSLSAVEAELHTTFSVTDARHPIFKAFGGLVGTLGQVRVRRAIRVTETAASQVVARFDDGTAALVEYPVGPGRAMVFASDLNNAWNDFPRRPAFVPFVYETLHYLIGGRDNRRELTITDMPAGLEPQPGVTRLPATGTQVVVNVDPRESDPTRVTQDAFLSHIVPRDVRAGIGDPSLPVATREAEQGYWWYALLAMVCLLVAETVLSRSMV